MRLYKTAYYVTIVAQPLDKNPLSPCRRHRTLLPAYTLGVPTLFENPATLLINY